jgi:ribose transport system permease protein
VNAAAVRLRQRARDVPARLERFESLFIALVLVVIVAVFAVWAPSGTFFTVDNLKNILLDASEILILAVGMTFLLIAAGIDLSIGSVVVFSAVAAAKVMGSVGGTSAQIEQLQYPHLARALFLGIAAGVLVGAGWGLVNGVLAVKTGIPPFIATLATLGIVLGLAQVWTGGINVQSVPLQLQESYGLGELFGVVPWPVVTAVVITAVLWVLLSRTAFGLRTYAIGANPEAARRAGINVTRHLMLLYVLMGLLAGVTGVVDVARFNTASIAGHEQDALSAIAAVVIGGTSLFGGRGRISETVVGALIPAVLNNGFIIVGVQPFWQNVAVGCVLLLAVFLDQLRRKAAS